jgi:hypothetical protein
MDMNVSNTQATRIFCHAIHTARGTRVDCAGKLCMAWRWAESRQAAETSLGGPPPRERKGYCGLVGKPEFSE